MNDFNSVCPDTRVLDPSKRVNYIHGLVLGVDEFKQEECYLLEKDRLHNRNLHGYGTVCGLKVSQQEEAGGLQIKVDPGLAISPIGQVIQVTQAQCATLNEWLESHDDELASVLGSPPAGPISLYLMLCYRECKTDLVPIPTGPCQALEDSTAPSRIADDFSLSLELQPPPEEHLASPMQEFFDLLLGIPVEAGGAMTLEELKQLVRSLIPVGSPSGSPSLPPGNSAGKRGRILPRGFTGLDNRSETLPVDRDHRVRACRSLSRLRVSGATRPGCRNHRRRYPIGSARRGRNRRTEPPVSGQQRRNANATGIDSDLGQKPRFRRR